jgi:hypothetical protein
MRMRVFSAASRLPLLLLLLLLLVAVATAAAAAAPPVTPARGTTPSRTVIAKLRRGLCDWSTGKITPERLARVQRVAARRGLQLVGQLPVRCWVRLRPAERQSETTAAAIAALVPQSSQTGERHVHRLLCVCHCLVQSWANSPPMFAEVLLMHVHMLYAQPAHVQSRAE